MSASSRPLTFYENVRQVLCLLYINKNPAKIRAKAYELVRCFSSSLIIFLIRLGIQVGEIRALLKTPTLEAAMIMTYAESQFCLKLTCER